MNNNSNAYTTIQKLYPSVIDVNSIEDLPQKGYMVYILLCNDKAIVVGHGKKNRSKVIFDKSNGDSTTHYKAILVRLYMIYEPASEYRRCIIPCDSKEQSKSIEYILHKNKNVGGAGMNFTQKINDVLKCEENSIANMLIKIALASNYDGLSDLKKWRKNKIIDDTVWSILKKKFNLSD